MSTKKWLMTSPPSLDTEYCRMLEFYNDSLDKYLDRSNYQFVEVDTHSQYVALSAPIDKESIDKDLSYHPLMSMVKPDLLEELKAML